MMRRRIFLETYNPYHSSKEELFRATLYGDFNIMNHRTGFVPIVEKEVTNMKFEKCLTCTHSDNPWRCGCCNNADMFAPIENTITTEKEYHKMYSADHIKPTRAYHIPQIKNVIFSGPATIILWGDNTKTVVKCDKDDIYDPHTGMAEAIAKKALGDDYRKTFRKYIKKYNKQMEKEIADSVSDFNQALSKIAEDAVAMLMYTHLKRGETD